MGRPDGAHTHGHGGGGGLGLNGAADALNRYVLLPIAAVMIVGSFLHFILIALLCVGALVVGWGIGFVAARYVVGPRLRARRAAAMLPPAAARPSVPGQYRPGLAAPAPRGLPSPVADLRRLAGRVRGRP